MSGLELLVVVMPGALGVLYSVSAIKTDDDLTRATFSITSAIWFQTSIIVVALYALSDGGAS